MIDIEGNIPATMLSLLCHNPQYLKGSLLTEEYFLEPYRSIFAAMKDSIAKHGIIDADYISDFNGVNRDDFMSLLWEEQQGDITTYKRLEGNIVDAYKRRQYIELAKRLQLNQIDVYGFKYGVNNLNVINVNNLHKLDKNSILRSLSTVKSNPLLEFKNFPRHKSIAKIVEHDLVVIAGKTGRGKTGYCLNLANDLAETYPVIYISMELSEQSIRNRLIAMNSNVPVDRILSPMTIPQKHVEVIKSYAARMEKEEFYIEEGSQSIETIERTISSFPQDKHFVVFVDHLGYIRNRGKDIRERTTETIKSLRQMSLDYNCTIFAISHVHRTDEKRPSLSMLKESGEIENSARKVLFLWEPAKEDEYYIFVSKNDAGPLGYFKIDYRKNVQKIAEV